MEKLDILTEGTINFIISKFLHNKKAELPSSNKQAIRPS